MSKAIGIAKEVLSPRGLEWLKVDVCNCYAGNHNSEVATDKLLRHEQIKWVDDNLSELHLLVADAEEMPAYRRALKVLSDALYGKPVAHMMYVDASNQALQLYAVLTSCKATALVCNLATRQARADAYSMLAEALNEVLGCSVFNRKNCKKALMTTLYGSRESDVQIMCAMHNYEKSDVNEIQDALAKLALDLGVELYPDGEDSFLKVAFNEAMVKIAPNAMKAMAQIQKLNKLGRESYMWAMPDGFIVKYDVKKDVEVSFDFEYQGIVESMEFVEEDVYMADKKSAGMAPNIIHSVDGWICRQLILFIANQGRFITTTHDAFGVHLNDVDMLKNKYDDLLVALNGSNLLEQIIKQVANGASSIPVVSQEGDLVEEDIRASIYSLC